MRDVTGFGLEEEEQVSVFLGLVVVGEEAFLGVDVVEMAGGFILLEEFSYFCHRMRRIQDGIPYLFQSHAILNQQGYPRIQVSHIFLEDKVLL